MSYGEWEAVVGVEIHAQLNTKTKLFSSAPNSLRPSVPANRELYRF